MTAFCILSIALLVPVSSQQQQQARSVRLTDYLKAESDADTGAQQTGSRPKQTSGAQRQSSPAIARQRLQPLGRLEVQLRPSASGAEGGAGASGVGGHSWASFQRVQQQVAPASAPATGPRRLPRGPRGVLNATRGELRGGVLGVGATEGCEAREFVQVVRARGCRPAYVRNRYCIGVCASLFIPQESEFITSQAQRTQQRGPRDTFARVPQPQSSADSLASPALDDRSSQTATNSSQSTPKEDLVEAIPRPKRQSSIVANVNPTTLLRESQSAGPAAQLLPDDGDVRHTRAAVTRGRSCRPVWLTSAASALSNPPAMFVRGSGGSGAGSDSSSAVSSGGSAVSEWVAVRLDCPARSERTLTKLVHIVQNCQCAA